MTRQKLARFIQGTVLAIALALVPVALYTGCSTLNRGSYQATGVATVTVDKAMSAWGDYVGKYHPGIATETKVKSAYENYQASINLVADTAAAYLRSKAANDPNTPAAQAAFNNAIAGAASALGDLEKLIISFGVKL